MTVLPTTGAVVLNGLTFTTNPETYEPFNWTRRASYNPTIGGGLVIQDFGVFQKDLTLKLASGNAQFLKEADVISLHGFWRALGTTYALTDWLNNAFTVFIKTFVPVPYKPGLYRYSMDLQVVTITKLWNVVYTGS